MNQFKKFVSIILLIGLFASFFTGVGPASVHAYDNEKMEDIKRSDKVFVLDNVQIYFTPNEESAVAGYAERGDTVIVLERTEEWTKVKFRGLKGYIYNQYLSKEDPLTPAERAEKDKKDAEKQKQNIQMIPQHVHYFTVGKTVAPDCTHYGYTEEVCQCGAARETNIVPALGHKWNEWEIVKEPTYKEAGEKKRECTVCGQIEYASVDKLVCPHDYTDTVKEPTCTEKGYTKHHCNICDDEYIDSYVDALGHDLKDIVVKETGCLENGEIRHVCQRPGCDYEEVEHVNAFGHNWSEWIVDSEATEDEEGLMHRECGRCHTKEERVIPKKDHVHIYVKTVIEPTCTEQGYTLNRCRCGDEFKTDYVAPKGHDYIEKVIKAPTCTEAGELEFNCSRGDASYTKTVAPLGHDWSEWTVDVEATEETAGSKSRHCCRSGCGEVETQVIPKKEHVHQYVETVVAPTCLAEGYTAHKCKCGDYFEDNRIPALGHDWGAWTVDKEPTETEKGHQYRFCERCNIKEEQDIPEKEHVCIYVTETIAPTCTNQGYTHYHCNGCGKDFNSDFVPAKGHSMSGWTVVTNPTEDSTGLETRHCMNCSYSESRVIDKIPPHVHNWSITTTTSGSGVVQYITTTKTCACGASESSTEKVVVESEVKKVGQDLFDLTNKMREDNKLRPYDTPNKEWQDWADLRAQELDQKFSHTRPNGESCHEYKENEQGITEMAYGENVAYNWWEYNITGQTFYDMFIDSPGHKANMMDSSDTLAVGVYVNPDNGKIYCSMVMIRPCARMQTMRLELPEDAVDEMLRDKAEEENNVLASNMDNLQTTETNNIEDSANSMPVPVVTENKSDVLTENNVPVEDNDQKDIQEAGNTSEELKNEIEENPEQEDPLQNQEEQTDVNTEVNSEQDPVINQDDEKLTSEMDNTANDQNQNTANVQEPDNENTTEDVVKPVESQNTTTEVNADVNPQQEYTPVSVPVEELSPVVEEIPALEDSSVEN